MSDRSSLKEVIFMAIKTDIANYLSANGRSTTGAMANSLGYSTGQVRKACKEMMANGRINGDKSKRIPAYIINGDYVVLPSVRSVLLEVIKKYGSLPPSASSMSVKQFRNYIKQHIADRVVGGPEIWEFWQ